MVSTTSRGLGRSLGKVSRNSQTNERSNLRTASWLHCCIHKNIRNWWCYIMITKWESEHSVAEVWWGQGCRMVWEQHQRQFDPDLYDKSQPGMKMFEADLLKWRLPNCGSQDTMSSSWAVLEVVPILPGKNGLGWAHSWLGWEEPRGKICFAMSCAVGNVHPFVWRLRWN